MVFDRKSFFEFEDDVRYTLLSKSIKADSSNRSYEMMIVPPQTAQGTQNFPSSLTAGVVTVQADNPYFPSVYNNGATHFIDMYYGADYKANLEGTMLLMTYQAYQYRSYTTDTVEHVFAGCPIPPLADVGYSLPFDPGFWFQNMYLLNGISQDPIEQYVFQNLIGNICTARHLQEFKREALENNSMSFFTPCVESKFDDTTLSAESIERAKRWLCGASPASPNEGGNNVSTINDGTKIKTFTKAIPLSIFFNSASAKGFWINSPKIRFQFTMKMGDEICFCSGPTNPPPGASTVFGQGSQAAARSIYNTGNVCSPVYIAVTGMSLLQDSARMSSLQQTDTARDKVDSIVNNIGFFEYFPIPAVSSQQIIVTSQRDVEQVILGYEAYLAPTAVAGSAGPVQNPAQKDNGHLSSIAITYGNDQCIRTPLRLDANLIGDTLNVYNNTVAYAMYAKSCNADKMNLVPLAIPFDRYFCYNYYYLPIYPSSQGVHVTSDPRDIRIDNAAATEQTSRTIVTIIKKLTGVQIDSSGQCAKLN